MANQSKIKLLQSDKALKEITRLIALGNTEHAVALKFGLSQHSFIKYKKQDEHIRDAIAAGYAKTVSEVVSSLLKRAKGYNKVETTKKYKFSKDENGKTVKELVGEVSIDKHYPASEKAIMLYLINKDPANWSSKEQKAAEQVVEAITGSLTKEQLIAKLKEKREANAAK